MTAESASDHRHPIDFDIANGIFETPQYQMLSTEYRLQQSSDGPQCLSLDGRNEPTRRVSASQGSLAAVHLSCIEHDTSHDHHLSHPTHP